MLKTKLFQAFLGVIVLFSVLSALIATRIITKHTVLEAQNRVRLDLSSAWAVYNSHLRQIETILQMTATEAAVKRVIAQGEVSQAESLRHRLEEVRVRFGLDFLNVIAPDGKILLRTIPPYHTGDFKSTDAAISSALQGTPKTCMSVFSSAELKRESEALAEQSFMELKATRHARRTSRDVEDRGMVMVGAVPIIEGASVAGALYGGVLVNRNHALIDRIHDVVYRDETYDDHPLGTATIFLHDSRVTTTVREANGNRALATRVSREVAEHVLDNGRAWVGDAFVVHDHYLTAYDPIRDGNGDVIGMLYVGILKRPFDVYRRNIIVRYILLSLFVLAVGLLMAFVTAGRLSQPIHRLVEAANRMRSGARPAAVPTDHACHETEMLIHAFNGMTETLCEREDRLKALNRSYMETLGFVSHELKSPVAVIVNYTYLLRHQQLGPLNERQLKAVAMIDSGSHRIVEMVRHYLNLSRIENGELQPVRSRVDVRNDVLEPLLESSEHQIVRCNVTVENRIPADTMIDADLNMVREVFENMISNVLKYGRDGGTMRLTAERRDGMFAFTVWNDGEGIPADKIDSIGEKFNRIESSAVTRKQKGTGLGLFIVKHIVEAHGGTFSVASTYGEWAAFTFTFPVATEEEEAQQHV